MSDQAATEEIDVLEIAEYLRDIALELAVMAREAGLNTVAGGLEQTYRAADAEVRAFQSGDANAEPDDAA